MDSRLPKIKLIFLLFFLAVLTRLGYWQIVQAQELSLQADLQHLGTHVLPYQRGKIYFSDRFPLVSNELRHQLFVEPPKFKPTFSQVQELNSLLESTGSAHLIDQAMSSHQFWFPIVDRIDESLKDQINRLSLPGIGF